MLFVLAMALVAAVHATAQETADVPAVLPKAVIDLRTDGGVALVGGQWRYSDARIVEVSHHAVGADLRPSGPANRTNDIETKAGSADFDDSAWQRISAPSLEDRRGNGRLSFNWYRIKLTLPEKVGGLDVTGKTVVFEVVIDDYAEIWVNGKLPVVLGQTGGQMVKGFNAPNRVVLTRDARPGQQFMLAVFGANGPISSPPGNFIWVRSATLDFYEHSQVAKSESVATDIQKKDAALDAIVTPGTKIEKLAGGFQFTEGPVWVRDGGYLLFSDPNANTIYRYDPQTGAISVFRAKSGFSGVNIGEYHQAGSNGLTLDKNGLLTINQHGNRRVIRVEKPGNITVLAESYEGKRLNSPNDLVYRSDGTLYFTDPPFGLPRVFDDPKKELPFSGVFMVKDGKVTLVAKDFTGPNGLAFSPDEKYLYVDNWDEKRKWIFRYSVNSDGTLGKGELFFDMNAAPGEDALDGLKVDKDGNVYASGPGGLWVISSAGKHLGTIVGPEHPHNMAWGDEDGKTLYLCARTGLYKIRLNVEGIRP